VTTGASDPAAIESLAQLVDVARLGGGASPLPQVDPGAEALTDGTRSLTWAELIDEVARSAATLVDVGVAPGDRVAVHLTKSVESFVAVHAVVRAGGVMVPLDPLAPSAHLANVLVDAGAVVLITDARSSALQALFAEEGVAGQVTAVVRPRADQPIPLGPGVVEVLADAIAGSAAAPRVRTGPNDAAYIIYTSGSTGRPKGIVHTNASALAYAIGAASAYGLRADDRLANIAPLHFDQSTFELYAGPVAGACTIVVPDPILRFPASLSAFVEAHRATVWYSVPYLIGQLSTRGALNERDLSSLRWVLFGGESFPPGQLAAVMRQLPAARFSNVYGPAEVNQCTALNLDDPPGGDQAVSIGRAWEWADVRIVDGHDSGTSDEGSQAPGSDRVEVSDVDTGEPGELLVRSATLMQGYWNRPDLTARSIVRLTDADGRWYRTGDLVARRPDGDLDFLGRIDNQIKLRGHRIELEAVDAALRDLDGVAAATAVVDRPEGAEHRLVALIVADAPPLDRRRVLSELARRLPRYAVPAEVIAVAGLPRTATGKVDRNAAHDLLSQPADS